MFTKDRWREIEANYSGRVKLVVFDFTDQATTKASRVEAKRLGLEKFFDEVVGETGSITVVDGRTKEMTASIHGTAEFYEYRNAIEASLRTVTEEAERWHQQVIDFEKELEKQRKSSEQKQAAAHTDDLLKKATTPKDIPLIVENLGDVSGDYLRVVAENLKSKGFAGVAVLAGASGGKAGLVAYVGPPSTSRFQAGQIIKTLAPIIGGGGGGRPDFAQAGGKNPEKISEALKQAVVLLGV
jgi:alanyl-tRNA synthetase